MIPESLVVDRFTVRFSRPPSVRERIQFEVRLVDAMLKRGLGANIEWLDERTAVITLFRVPSPRDAHSHSP